jgi:tetratricopeptide (TPR) repeat protein
LKVRANEAETFNNLGLCLLELGDGPAAAEAFRSAIALKPLEGQSHFNLGRALTLTRLSYEGFLHFKKAAELEPGNVGSYVYLFAQMSGLLNWEEGLPLLEGGVRENPDVPRLRVDLAITYGKVGQATKARENFELAWARSPDFGSSYAQWLQEEGHFEESIRVLQETVRRDPGQGSAYHGLAVVKQFEIDGKSLIDLAASIESQEALRPYEQMHLAYALAKAYEEGRDYGKAMEQYDRANTLAHGIFLSKEVFDAAKAEAFLGGVRGLFTRELMAALSEHGSSSEMPIFIVGMIRSGTTMLDQIISSHPEVQSVGEQVFWHFQTNSTYAKWEKSGQDPADVADMATRYLRILEKTVAKRGGVAPIRITDKMPINYYYLGLMRVAFPKARIIHLRRNPLDTALSIYSTFLGHGTPFANSQRNIVDAYRIYLGYMDHWRSVFSPEQFLEVDYERLVSNKESVIPKIIEFCGLQWDDACLSNERNQSQVSTPSRWTARQPINTGSVERWRRFEPWLGELKELADVAHPELPTTVPW